jgi:protein-L-isoaspartate(D-aspartate) O-methyltransferase
MPDYAAQRLTMVESQVRANDVTDQRIAAAMREIPREKFVPGTKRSIAYADAAIEVAPGRFLPEPRTFAKLLQLADVRPEDSVLDVACATGYSTAVIARLARAAIGLEQDADLLRTAYETVPTVGTANATIVQGALVEGFSGKAPYNVIFINGAVEKVPEGLLTQLAEGGRLVTVIRKGALDRACLYLREHGSVGHRFAFDAPAPLLVGFRETVGFVF